MCQRAAENWDPVFPSNRWGEEIKHEYPPHPCSITAEDKHPLISQCHFTCVCKAVEESLVISEGSTGYTVNIRESFIGATF